MMRIAPAVVVLAVSLGTSGCASLSSLWPWGGPDLPEPAELPDPKEKERFAWLPDLPDLPAVDLWPFGSDWEGPAPDLSQVAARRRSRTASGVLVSAPDSSANSRTV